ncbi:molybdate ABC transporter substrate-binding protein [Sinomonas mesophila]|uniref:molybdate ABC transporter substrate-binding protein n=1 Tax=Sinomonas mesophila TaxID=1531955 RepID=UPI001FEBBD38|nr:molybdate ABC transporter substrate-binding protein [Sinomonas mesophila]
MSAALAALVLSTAPLLAGCTPPSGERSLTVFAAASLRQSFTEIGEAFEAAHPGVRVALNVAGSSDLAAQIAQGAPADVFASADTTTMDRVTGAGLADGDAAVFATNVLTIAVAPGNPDGITGLADLSLPGLRLVQCAPQVPCGSAAQAAAARAGVDLAPVSEEPTVTDVLGKVISGEADAGLVYVTDVRGAGGAVEGVAFPESAAAVNRYPIAALRGAREPELAREFAAFVAGAEARKVLEDAGFGAP